MTDVSLDALADLLLAADRGKRLLVAIAGPPGVGKSTTCERLVDRLNAAVPGLAGLLPMDGYHFDDAVLHERGHRPRKGAPHTFDLGGLAAMIDRLRLDDGSDIAVPVFDRSIEIARAGARIVDGRARIIIVEGNYLLLDWPGWKDLAFDVTVMLEADEAVLESRLTARWQGFGYEGQAMLDKMEGNDLPNMRLVLRQSRAADYTLRTDAA